MEVTTLSRSYIVSPFKSRSVRLFFLLWMFSSLVLSLGLLAFSLESQASVRSSFLDIPEFLDLSSIPSFWGNLSEIDATVDLNVTQASSTILSSPHVSGVLLNYTTLRYVSHFVNGHPVEIFARLFQPVNHVANVHFPGIVMIHGLRSDSTALIDKAMKLASFNYVVLTLDLPGHGGISTGIPPFSPETSLNVTPTPRNSHFYHAAVSVYRAISVLTTLPRVDVTKLGLVGGSFGGIMTFIVAALDSRVKAAIPVLESGYFLDAFRKKMYSARLVPRGTNFDSPIVRTFLQSFDPLIYAAHIRVPTFMMIGTHDQVTTLDAFNLTYSVIPSGVEKNILILPRAKHEMFEELDDNTLWWFEYVFKDAPSPPRIDAHFSGKKMKLDGEVQSIKVVLTGLTSTHRLLQVQVGFKEDIPGFGWKARDSTRSFIKNKVKNGTVIAVIDFKGFLLPLGENLIVVARFSSGVVVSSVLLKPRLFHSLTIPFVTILNGALFLVLTSVIRDFRRVHSSGYHENGKKWKIFHHPPKMRVLLIHYGVGSLIIGSYLACYFILPLFSFTGSWVTWTIFEFLDVFVRQDLIVYFLAFIFLGSTASWLLKRDVLAAVVMLIPPLMLMWLVMSGNIPDEFSTTSTWLLMVLLAISMGVLPILEFFSYRKSCHLTFRWR